MDEKTTVSGGEFAFRDLESSDATALIDLAKSTIGASWTEEFVLWKYFGNPTGRVSGCCAEMDHSLVGFYGGVPVRIKVGDRVILGAQAADAMVSQCLRRSGLFVRMGHHTIGRLSNSGIDLIYAMANAASRAGSVKHHRYAYSGEIPTFIKAIDPVAVTVAAGRSGPSAWIYRIILSAVGLTNRPARSWEEDVSVRELPAFDERFDRLWADASASFSAAVVRDVAYLNWRYVQNPLKRYVILVAERGDTLLGYTVLSFRDAEQKGTIALAELMLAPRESSAGLALLCEVTRRARESGYGQIQCWMLPQHTFYTQLLREGGFVYAPSRLLPGIFRQSTSFITRVSANSGMVPDPTKLENWFLTMGDQDYY